MKPLLSKDDFIETIAKRSRYLKIDVKNILAEIISVMEESIREHESFKEDEDKKLVISVRGFGKLYIQKIPKRLGSKGEELPSTTRPIFRLSENIRYANKFLIDKDLDKNEE